MRITTIIINKLEGQSTFYRDKDNTILLVLSLIAIFQQANCLITMCFQNAVLKEI